MSKSFVLNLFAILVFAQISSANPLQPVKLDHPRDTMRTFMEAMQEYREGRETNNSKKLERIDDAIQTLDLSELPVLMRQESGKEIAILLKEVIDRVIEIDYSKIPDNSETTEPIDRWRLKGTEITIVRRTDGDDAGEYQFSKETVARTKNFYSKVKNLPYVEGTGKGALYQEPLFDRTIPNWARQEYVGLKTWQWLGILASVILGLIIRTLVAFLVDGLKIFTKKIPGQLDDKLVYAIDKPVGLIAATGFWFYCLHLLRFEGFFLSALTIILQITLSVGIILIVYRAMDVIVDAVAAWANKSTTLLDDQLVKLLRRSFRVIVVIFGTLVALQNLGVNVMSVLAGLGLGGLAFALAAKDTCANFFGSLMIMIDRPFRVGDYIQVGNVEGIVEDIGFRSTRVRTFYKSVVSIPNANLTVTDIDNLGIREVRRYLTSFGLTYDTPPEKMEAFVEGVKNIVLANEYTDKENFFVSFNEYAGSSLNVLLICYFKPNDYNVELYSRQNINLEVLRLADSLGVNFAFPSTSVYLEGTPEHPFKGVENLPDDQLTAISTKFGPGSSESRPRGKGIAKPLPGT